MIKQTQKLAALVLAFKNQHRSLFVCDFNGNFIFFYGPLNPSCNKELLFLLTTPINWIWQATYAILSSRVEVLVCGLSVIQQRKHCGFALSATWRNAVTSCSWPGLYMQYPWIVIPSLGRLKFRPLNTSPKRCWRLEGKISSLGFPLCSLK